MWHSSVSARFKVPTILWCVVLITLVYIFMTTYIYIYIYIAYTSNIQHNLYGTLLVWYIVQIRSLRLEPFLVMFDSSAFQWCAWNSCHMKFHRPICDYIMLQCSSHRWTGLAWYAHVLHTCMPKHNSDMPRMAHCKYAHVALQVSTCMTLLATSDFSVYASGTTDSNYEWCVPYEVWSEWSLFPSGWKSLHLIISVDRGVIICYPCKLRALKTACNAISSRTF